MSDRLTLLRPDDWHIHLRDGAVLPHTVGDVARTFARAIIMPNLVPPVRNAAEADAYRQRRAEGINVDYCDGVLDTVELMELL
jgi:dihydroorotase